MPCDATYAAADGYHLRAGKIMRDVTCHRACLPRAACSPCRCCAAQRMVRCGSNLIRKRQPFLRGNATPRTAWQNNTVPQQARCDMVAVRGGLRLKHRYRHHVAGHARRS